MTESDQNTLPVDLHSHTLASGHAFNTLDEMARQAQDLGIRILGVTDHGPSMEGASSSGYFEMAARVPSVIYGVRVLMGCEANIIDTAGHLDLPDNTAAQQRVLIAGLHSRTPYPLRTSRQENTAALLGAIGNPHVHIISHPYRSDFPVNVCEIAEAACDHRTLVEINLALFRKILKRKDEHHQDEVVQATRQLLRRLQDRGGGFVVNSDAHHSAELGCRMDLLHTLADLLEFKVDNILNFSPHLLAAYLPCLDKGAVQGDMTE